MKPDLVGLNGGKKQFWLRTHRKEVEAFLDSNGPDATMVEFNLTPNTLKRFLERKTEDERHVRSRLTQSDRWVLAITNEGLRELKKHLRELEEWRQQVQPVLALGQALIDATMVSLKNKVETPALSNDPLRLDNLDPKLGNRVNYRVSTVMSGKDVTDIT